MRTKPKGIVLSLCLSIFLFFGLLLAAENENGPKQKIDSYSRFMPSSKVKAQAGKVEIIEAGAEYSYEFKAPGSLPMKFSLDNRYIGIENSTAVGLPAHLVGLSMDIETTLPFFDFKNTYLRLGVSPSFYADDWDFPASSFRVPVRSFLIYQPNDAWTFLGGVAVYPDFEREVYPILGFIYKASDKLAFNIVPKRPNISYLLNEKTTFFLEGGTSFGEYEVTRDNSKNEVLRYKHTHLGAGLKYKFNKYLAGSISFGGAFNRGFKYRDGVGKVNIKDAPYGEFRFEARI